MSRSLCLACGAEMRPWLYMPVDPMKDEPTPFSSVLRCAGCGLGSLSPLPSADQVAALYDLPSYYTHGNGAVSSGPASIPARALSRLARIADRSTPFSAERIAQSLRPDARICDLGCGHAHYLRAFKELGFDVIGVDPDPSAREEAAQAGVTVLPGTAENAPEITGQFDLVLMTHSLEHCRDPKKAVENAYRLTAPGGRCYVEVPNCASEPFQTFTICSAMFDAPRHMHFFTPDCLSQLARRAGFAVRRRSFMYYDRDFAPSWRSWESSIADKVAKLGPKRHTFAASVSLFLRSFWRPPERKYDSFGLWLSA